MSSNSFGTIFRITTFGESHGKGIGVIIDGCPAGLSLSDEDINQALALRAPGQNPFTSPRKEMDHAEIYSGVFENKTTGAPIAIIIPNKDADSTKYEPIKQLLRPGHANFTYLEKYGIFDYRGGGRSSARETACRVAASAVANKLLDTAGIKVMAFLSAVGHIKAGVAIDDVATWYSKILQSPIFCPDESAAQQMQELILTAKEQGDSLGGVVTFVATGLPAGLGDPVYEKIEANLAKAMMSLPATKGFEMGQGFHAVEMRGSEHNDPFIRKGDKITTETNYAGGTLGGITTGLPIMGRVAFKPTSSITKQQTTVTTEGDVQPFNLPEGSRHDPCVAIRGVPCVAAMCSLVLADALLLNRCAK